MLESNPLKSRIRILISRGGILTPVGNFPETPSQQISTGIINISGEIGRSANRPHAGARAPPPLGPPLVRVLSLRVEAGLVRVADAYRNRSWNRNI